MSSALENTLRNVPMGFYGWISDETVRLCNDEFCSPYWTYPLNGIVCILEIALQPLFILATLITGVVCKIISCMANPDRWETEATIYLLAARWGAISIGMLFARIFDPKFEFLEKAKTQRF